MSEPEGVGRRGDERGEDAWWRGSARCLRTAELQNICDPSSSPRIRCAEQPYRELRTCTTYRISSLPNAGSAHSLYCSGVQYGASPTDKSQKTKTKKVKISKMISYCKFFFLKKLHFLTHKSMTFLFCPCCLSNAAIRLASLGICKATALNLLTFLLLLPPYLHLYTCWLSSPLPCSSFSLSQLSSPSLSFGPVRGNRCARIRESRGVIEEMKRTQ